MYNLVPLFISSPFPWRVKVQLDANHAVEVSPDEDELDESDDEEGDQEYIEVSSATNYTVLVGFPPLI